MMALKLLVIFCVFLVQGALSQITTCQTDLVISMDDVLCALNKKGLKNACGRVVACQESIGIPTPDGGYSPCACQRSTEYTTDIPSLQKYNQCGCGAESCIYVSPPTLSIQPSSYSKPSISLVNQPCGCQVSQPCFTPVSCGCSQSCGCAPEIQIQPYCGSSCNVRGSSCGGEKFVPNAVQQAPPYGIQFEGDKLIIDGEVQVKGAMPFNSAVEISGCVPTSGTGYTSYSCGECKTK